MASVRVQTALKGVLMAVAYAFLPPMLHCCFSHDNAVLELATPTSPPP